MSSHESYSANTGANASPEDFSGDYEIERTAVEHYRGAQETLGHIEAYADGDREKVDGTVADFIDYTQQSGNDDQQDEAGLVGFIEVNKDSDALKTAGALGAANDRTIRYAVETVEAVFPGSAERALQIVERAETMRLTVPSRGEVTDRIPVRPQRIEMSRESKMQQGHQYISGRLDALDQISDPKQREYVATETVLDIVNRTAAGEIVGKNEDLYRLVETLPELQVDRLLRQHPEALGNMMSWMSDKEIQRDNFEAHKKTLRIAEKMTGTSALEWRSLQRKGVLIPDFAENYMDKRFLTVATLDNRMDQLPAHFDSIAYHPDGRLRSEHETDYEWIGYHMKEAVCYSLDTERNPDLQGMAEEFFAGDIGYRRLGRQRDIVGEYVQNIDTIGSSQARTLHQRLGTVNFGSYKLEQLHDMVEILEGRSSADRIGVVMRGKDGDHNGFVSDYTDREPLRDTLVFEVGQSTDMAGADNVLRQVGKNVSRLTIIGHGGENGIHLSSNTLLQRNAQYLAHSPLMEITKNIKPDSQGERNISILSCSAGRDFDSKGSFARIMSEIDPGLRIQAAADIMYADTPDTLGMVGMRVDRKAERWAKTLDKRRKRRDGKKSVIAGLMRNTMIRTTGGITTLRRDTFKNGQRSHKKDARVKIGV